MEDLNTIFIQSDNTVEDKQFRDLHIGEELGVSFIGNSLKSVLNIKECPQIYWGNNRKGLLLPYPNGTNKDTTLKSTGIPDRLLYYVGVNSQDGYNFQWSNIGIADKEHWGFTENNFDNSSFIRLNRVVSYKSGDSLLNADFKLVDPNGYKDSFNSSDWRINMPYSTSKNEFNWFFTIYRPPYRDIISFSVLPKLPLSVWSGGASQELADKNFMNKLLVKNKSIYMPTLFVDGRSFHMRWTKIAKSGRGVPGFSQENFSQEWIDKITNNFTSINELSEQLNTLSTNLDNINSNLTAYIQSNITQIESKITESNINIGNNTSDIAVLNTKYTELRNDIDSINSTEERKWVNVYNKTSGNSEVGKLHFVKEPYVVGKNFYGFEPGNEFPTFILYGESGTSDIGGIVLPEVSVLENESFKDRDIIDNVLEAQDYNSIQIPCAYSYGGGYKRLGWAPIGLAKDGMVGFSNYNLDERRVKEIERTYNYVSNFHKHYEWTNPKSTDEDIDFTSSISLTYGQVYESEDNAHSLLKVCDIDTNTKGVIIPFVSASFDVIGWDTQAASKQIYIIIFGVGFLISPTNVVIETSTPDLGENMLSAHRNIDLSSSTKSLNIQIFRRPNRGNLSINNPNSYSYDYLRILLNGTDINLSSEDDWITGNNQPQTQFAASRDIITGTVDHVRNYSLYINMSIDPFNGETESVS